MSRGLNADERAVHETRDDEPVPGRPSSSTDHPAPPERPDQWGSAGGTASTDVREVPVVWRDRTVHLRASAHATLLTVGTFRTVALADLARHAYRGDQARMDADVRALVRRGWVERHTVPGRRGGRAQPVLTLSKEGQAFTIRHIAAPEQRLHTGLVKAKELAHDAALYRVAQAEGARIRRDGGTVRRVVLDAELKGELASARNRLGAGADAERTAAAAEALHLRVVGGAVQVPDVRLEYETREGTQARVDLELATEHYKPSQVAAKAQAGFQIYAPASHSGRLNAVLEERGIIAEILSL